MQGFNTTWLVNKEEIGEPVVGVIDHLATLEFVLLDEILGMRSPRGEGIPDSSLLSSNSTKFVASHHRQTDHGGIALHLHTVRSFLDQCVTTTNNMRCSEMMLKLLVDNFEGHYLTIRAPTDKPEGDDSLQDTTTKTVSVATAFPIRV